LTSRQPIVNPPSSTPKCAGIGAPPAFTPAVLGALLRPPVLFFLSTSRQCCELCFLVSANFCLPLRAIQFDRTLAYQACMFRPVSSARLPPDLPIPPFPFRIPVPLSLGILFLNGLFGLSCFGLALYTRKTFTFPCLVSRFVNGGILF